jgi:hypothetical protein
MTGGTRPSAAASGGARNWVVLGRQRNRLRSARATASGWRSSGGATRLQQVGCARKERGGKENEKGFFPFFEKGNQTKFKHRFEFNQK